MGKVGRRVLGEPSVWWGLSDRKVVESLHYQDAHAPCKGESSSGASGLSICSQHHTWTTKAKDTPTCGGSQPFWLPGRASLKSSLSTSATSHGLKADPSQTLNHTPEGQGHQMLGLHCQEADGDPGCFQAGFWPWTLFGGQGCTRDSPAPF